jgi:hypothetical protein
MRTVRNYLFQIRVLLSGSEPKDKVKKDKMYVYIEELQRDFLRFSRFFKEIIMSLHRRFIPKEIP